jgi:hypothetical protein
MSDFVVRDPDRDPPAETVAQVEDRILRLSPAALAAGDPCGCDEQCAPCARCTHVECDHHQARGCQMPGCSCWVWLSDTDCLHCGGMGDVSVDVETSSGRVLEDDKPCPWCRGTGQAMS